MENLDNQELSIFFNFFLHLFENEHLLFVKNTLVFLVALWETLNVILFWVANCKIFREIILSYKNYMKINF